jgi:hypothetical protein
LVVAQFEEGSGLGTLKGADLTNLDTMRSLGAPDGFALSLRVGCLSVDRASACLRRGLSILTLCRGRQLQHCRGLVGDQPSDLHDPAVRKFKCVVMNVRIVQIDLPKPCDPMTCTRASEEVQEAFVLDVTVKRHLGAGKEANGHLRFADGGKTAGDRFREFGRYQLISDPGGA